MPAVLRNDPTYPKVEWNAFAATGQGQGSWQPTETKYYPLIDDIAPLGFEEVVIDVNWWNGDTTHRPHPPVGHAEVLAQGDGGGVRRMPTSMGCVSDCTGIATRR